MSIPIVVIHKQDNFYLPYCLAQAKYSNPNSDIFLLGDSNNSHYKFDFLKHENISKHFKKAHLLKDIYKHLSTNPVSFELFCLQRWFVLRDFMLANHLENCVHIDSDLMLYADLSKEQEKFSQYDFTLNRGYSGHCSFINSVGALENFCDFIIDLYTDPSLFDLLEAKYQEQVVVKGLAGGACDMTALEEYRKRNPDKVGEMAVIIDGSVYDCNVKISDGFEMYNGMKKIYWVDDKPFCKELESGKKVRFNSLHFQGSSKKHMKNYYRGKNIRLNSLLLHTLLQSALIKTKNKLFKIK